MALIIEDGSIVAGADSFALAAELVTYAAAYGRTIPATEAAQESLLRRAYLDMNGRPWNGCLVSPDQTGAFPRVGLYRGDWLLPSNEIPAQIKAGQMALATEIYADDLVDPDTKVGAIQSETVGPLSTTYAKASASKTKPASVRQSQAQFAAFMGSPNQIRMVRG